MGKFAEVFICIIIISPLIGTLIYTIICPRESILFGRRWQFKNEDLEPSEEAIKFTRFMAIVVLIIMALALLFSLCVDLISNN